MPDERLLSIGSRGRLSPDDIARHTFSTNRRGFEQNEVRSFLEMVARELEAALERERTLHEALVDAEHRAANPVLDESTLTTALGQETARVLRSAHDAAGEITARAESDAARLRAEAEEEAEQIRSRAEQHAAERGAQVEAAATEMRRRLQEEEQSRLESAKLEAEALVSQARAECRAMVHEAQELRARVLSDLTRRRRILHSQIEQLRAGRERLAQTIGDVRHVVDRVTDELFRAEDEARLAAEAAGRHAGGDEDVGEAGMSEAGAGRPPTPDEAGAGRPPGPGQPAEPAHEGDEDRRHAVDELFARLRAEQGSDGGPGPTALAPAPASPQAEEQAAPARAEEQAAPAQNAPPAPEEGTPAAEPGPAPPVDPAVARRDELLAPALSGLVRRLKRALADDQNDLLDRLRGRRRFEAEVLGPEGEHERRYRQAAEAPLAEAARAGALFAGAPPEAAPPVTEMAGELARAVVAPLRRRLLDPALPAEEGDEAAMAEHVGSAFREWKGQRIERLAADHAHDAFWSAALATSSDGRLLHWVVDDDGLPCPDCDDNALAGSLAAGETFPTGHLHPPAHPGCRCLLVPGPA
jgi:DivIVA domain-containing protein